MPDQCLWHRSIHGIHGHMISVVRCPPQCKFRQISGSDHKRIFFVRNVHQNLRAFPRLGIFICHIMHRRVLSDIRKMHIYRLTDIHFHKFCPKALNQFDSIVICAVGCPESRHGDGRNSLTIPPTQIKGSHGHQKCQRRIQSSGNTYHSIGSGMFQTFF